VPQVFEKILLDLHQSEALQLGYVILDEIHFIQDRETGSVWERILLLLSETSPFVALSATIGNAEEFVAWIR
jgi:ATP-dependent RNA helicase HelY